MSLLVADIVAKVFFGWSTKILKTADALRARRREGPHRFIQKRAPAFVLAPENLAAAAASKNRPSRDFRGRPIFDFCNNIGTFRTWRDVRLESAFGGKAENIYSERVFRLLTTHRRHRPRNFAVMHNTTLVL